MDRLAAMKVFVRVVESGAFSKVAREAGTTQSAVSKQIAALEAHLGAKLLSRSSRALSLTEAGEVLLGEARRLLADFDAVETRLRTGSTKLTGWLRVATSVGYGRAVLMPKVKSFLDRHPGVRIDLKLGDDFADLIGQGIDVAIRLGRLPDSGLIARRIGMSQRVLAAHPAYLAGPEGAPALRHPRDLIGRNCIVYTEAATRQVWDFVKDGEEAVEVRVEGNLQTNSSEGVRAAALAGLGVCHAPEWLLRDELASGQLVRLLPDWAGRPFPIHAVYPADRRSLAKIDAFVAHMTEGGTG